MRPLEWSDRAACLDVEPELFHAVTPNAIREAKSVCLGCEVRATCLEYALTADERHGVWGGLDEDERARLRNPGPRMEPRPNKPTWDARCGSMAGVGRHRRANEALCGECRDARSDHRRALAAKARTLKETA